ncbi:hypothetical protein FZI91_16480 [Mycobacterium sp. CBMA271]|uniref:hypothetical protein n=1 Tax=unclassified Mycobacteroides TaxID=2618759 RepID=UPI0012DDC8FB|nr:MULTISPECIES: hypothetical protein [unclassified Mycobacteroides]MUM17048.1 hypothetical protein [Mycobacteroides sp. CBMA 326]MUM23286.1 hypothetical protein [Mycobacteroides sp. CBMA 271]
MELAESLEPPLAVGDDPLAALSRDFQAKAARLGIHLMRVNSYAFGEPMTVLEVRDDLLTMLDHAQILGVRLVYFSEEFLDEDYCEDLPEMSAYMGKCRLLSVGFPYNGIVHERTEHAPWTEVDDDFDELDSLNEELAARELPRGQYLREPERSRLVALAAEHDELKNLSVTASRAMREKIDELIFGIANEAGIELLEKSPTWVGSNVARQIIENQRAAMDAVDTELEDWAQRIGRHADFKRPTAPERERFCHQQLTAHLGFAPTKSLAERLRKLADSYRASGQAPELFP